MPSLGAPELLIIMVVVVFIFGVGKLPEIGGAMGKGIREFRSNAVDPVEPAAVAAADTRVKDEL